VFGADLRVRWCDPEKKMDGATKVSYEGGVLREYGGVLFGSEIPAILFGC
jgi:hypothetical protein